MKIKPARTHAAPPAAVACPRKALGQNGAAIPPVADDLMSAFWRDLSRLDIGVMTLGEEKKVLRAVRKGDEEAFERAVVCNIRLVAKIANTHKNLGIPLPDLINEGVIGLMHAVRRFNPRKGAKLSTYASWWIRQKIKRVIEDQYGPMRLSAHTHQTIRYLMRHLRNFERETERSPTAEELAAEAGMPPGLVRQYLSYAGREFIPLSGVVGQDDGRLNADIIADSRAPEPWRGADQILLAQQMEKALAKLTLQEKAVLEERFGFHGEIKTLEEVGKRFHLTRERIRQIQNKALIKLRRPCFLKLFDPQFLRHGGD